MNPNSWGSTEWLVSLTDADTHSWIVAYPKSTSSTSKDKSDVVTTAWRVKGTGLVWSATEISRGASSTPVTGSKYFPASFAKVFLKKKDNKIIGFLRRISCQEI